MGMTQAKLSALSGVHQSQISRVISGESKSFGPELAIKISRATHGAVTLEQLRMPLQRPRARKPRAA